MIASNQDVIESLFDQRRDMELKYMEKKQKQSQDYMDEISKMLIKDSEEYHKLKVFLDGGHSTHLCLRFVFWGNIAAGSYIFKLPPDCTVHLPFFSPCVFAIPSTYQPNYRSLWRRTSRL